jgi:hypothetical protein
MTNQELTKSEELLIKAIRESGIDIQHLANQLMNDYRGTRFYSNLAWAYNKIVEVEGDSTLTNK